MTIQYSERFWDNPDSGDSDDYDSSDAEEESVPTEDMRIKTETMNADGSRCLVDCDFSCSDGRDSEGLEDKMQDMGDESEMMDEDGSRCLVDCNSSSSDDGSDSEGEIDETRFESEGSEISKSEGFYMGFSRIHPLKLNPSFLQKRANPYSEWALEIFNQLKGSCFKFMEVVSAERRLTDALFYNITFKAEQDSNVNIFEAAVVESAEWNGGGLSLTDCLLKRDERCNDLGSTNMGGESTTELLYNLYNVSGKPRNEPRNKRAKRSRRVNEWSDAINKKRH